VSDYVLATTAATPDQEFSSLAALGRHIVSLRAKAKPGADGRPPEIALASGPIYNTDPIGHKDARQAGASDGDQSEEPRPYPFGGEA